MKKIRVVLIIISTLIFLALLIFFLVGYFRPKAAGILIETAPSSTVFIDGVQVGATPYEVVREPAEIVVKLVAQAAEKSYEIFETKINLVSGVKTVIRHEFAESQDLAQSEIMSFEKIGRGQTEFAIVSIPDAAKISIDGQVRGFAPYKTSMINAGEHELTVSADGFNDRTIVVKTVNGYKLIVVVKLSQSFEISPSPSPTTEDLDEDKKTLIEILSTPTGFLRVRAQPIASSAEIGQVKPGERFPFLEQDATTGWFKIEFGEGISGWVTNQYAKKVEEGQASPSPSPSPTPTSEPR